MKWQESEKRETKGAGGIQCCVRDAMCAVKKCLERKENEYTTWFLGDQLQQKYLYTSNYGHNGVSSVSCDATTFYKQRTCLHPGVLCLLTAKSRGTSTDLGCYSRTQRTGYFTDTYNAGENWQIHVFYKVSLFYILYLFIYFKLKS